MLTINEIKENCFSSSYTRGRELFLEKKFRNVEIRDMEDEDGDWVTRIRGEVKGSGNRWSRTMCVNARPMKIILACASTVWPWLWSTGKKDESWAAGKRKGQLLKKT